MQRCIFKGPNDPEPVYVYESSEPTLVTVNSAGYLAVVRPDIDYENVQHRSFNVLVTVREQGNPSQSGSALLSVQVLDINDNSPIFERSSYAESMDPGSPPRTVTTVSVAECISNAVYSENLRSSVRVLAPVVQSVV